MSLYGYDRQTTPFIDGLAAQGVVFEQAVTVAPNTLIAHASLFTGLFPMAHGVDPGDGGKALPEGSTTLSEDFLAAGYQTAGFVAHGDWLNERFGMSHGFEQFSTGYRPAQEVLAEASEFLENRDRDRPFFLFLHLFDVHSDEFSRPYDAPDGFRGRFTDGYEGPLLKRDEGDPGASLLLHSIGEGELAVGDDDIAYLRGQYDEGLSGLDAELGGFLGRHVDEVGDAYTVVLSDHGEEFMEHGRMLHGTFFDEVMRVPLVVTPPSNREHPLGPPREVPWQLSLVDLRPTLLALAELPEPVHSQGTNWLPWLSGAVGSPPIEPAFLGGEGVRYRGLKYMSGSVLRAQLYDIVNDPGERQNLIDDPRFVEQRGAMERLIRDMRKTSLVLHNEIVGVETVDVSSTPDLQRHLRALGYVDLADGRGSEVVVVEPTPWSFHYETPTALYIVGQAIEPNLPFVDPRLGGSFEVSPPLPDGLTIDPSTGVITGTPSKLARGRDYNITATMADGTQEQGLVLLKVREPFVRYAEQLLKVKVGEQMSPQIPQLYGPAPLRLRITPDLPPGLSFDQQTGRIEGTPTRSKRRIEHTVVAEYEGFPDAELTLSIKVDRQP